MIQAPLVMIGLVLDQDIQPLDLRHRRNACCRCRYVCCLFPLRRPDGHLQVDRMLWPSHPPFTFFKIDVWLYEINKNNAFHLRSIIVSRIAIANSVPTVFFNQFYLGSKYNHTKSAYWSLRKYAQMSNPFQAKVKDGKEAIRVSWDIKSVLKINDVEDTSARLPSIPRKTGADNSEILFIMSHCISWRYILLVWSTFDLTVSNPL